MLQAGLGFKNIFWMTKVSMLILRVLGHTAGSWRWYLFTCSLTVLRFNHKMPRGRTGQVLGNQNYLLYTESSNHRNDNIPCAAIHLRSVSL